MLPSGPLPRAVPVPPQAMETFIDGLVRDAMQADGIAGVTVSVVQDGQIVVNKGYGVADLSPLRRVDPNRTLFRLASISKTFTWLLMAQDIERRRYSPDTPVNDLLPPELQVPDQGYEEPIRVRHLMTHSAGFEDKALGHLFEDEAEEVRSRADYLAQERPSRVRPPGRLSVYSNYGVALAGAIVERANRRPYEEVLESRLTRPLGMDSTTIREPYPARDGLPAPMPAALAANVSKGFAPQAGAYTAHEFEYISQIGPAGGMSSTAGDMARYMLAILNGGTLDGVTIFGPRTAQALRTTMMRAAPGMNGWNYGFNTYQLPGGVQGIGHGGATSYFLSDMVIVPELRLGVFVSTNTAGGTRLASLVPNAIVGRFYGTPLEGLRPGDPALKDQADAYAGTYMSTRRAYSGLEKLAFTFAGATEVSVSDEGRLVMGGGRPSQWAPTGGGAGRFIRADGEEIIAFDVRDGRATRFYSPWGGAASERAPFHRSPQGLGLFAALAVLAAVLAIVGAFMRIGRDVRPTQAQAVSGAVLLAASVGWLAAVALVALWAQSVASDPAAPLYNWPGGVATGSWFALLSALLTLALLALLVRTWRSSDRRAAGWSVWRKLRHTAAVLVFAAFAVVVLLNGGLEPWSG
jgi:CubicO group peptidase (beta-lactamase class C family)